MATALASSDRLRTQVQEERARLEQALQELTEDKAEEANGKRSRAFGIPRAPLSQTSNYEG